MKSNPRYFVLFILLSSIATAQSKYQLNMRITAKSVDEKTEIVLHSHGELEGEYDGYIIFPNFMDGVQGGMKNGGFSLIDYSGMGSLFDSKKQREGLAKNKYPSGDLEVFSNGFDADKVLSFRIIPEFIEGIDDTATVFIKYVVYDFENKQVDYFNWDAKINLYNKLIRIPLNKEIPIRFMDEKLNDYKLSIYLCKYEVGKESILINDEKLFSAIRKSQNEAKLVNENINMNLTFYKSNHFSNDAFIPTLFHPKGELEVNISQMDSKSYKFVEFNSERIDLTNKIYYVNITTPFIIQNKAKSNEYSAYKSKDKIFRSDYNIYLLPISMEGNSLIADLFITLNKINIGDGIKRWSPIKKRVKLIISQRNPNNISTNHYYSSLVFELPKENWSAFFTREGEKYEIYGYSDYERLINEYINISLSKGKEEK